MLKQTRLLRDDPSSVDEMGSHLKVANLIKDEIVATSQGRSIAVVGEWGSGKSTVIKILESELKREGEKTHEFDPHVFVYDAWAHQGDPLRRSFLDDLIGYFEQHTLTTRDVLESARERIWSREEITETTSDPTIRKHALILLLSLAATPIGMRLIELPSQASQKIEIFTGMNVLGFALSIAPLILILIFGAINNLGPNFLRRFFLQY